MFARLLEGPLLLVLFRQRIYYAANESTYKELKCAENDDEPAEFL